MGRGRNPGPSRRGVDLTGIITFAEKEDLTTLVSRITEKMLRQIGDVFDSNPPVPSDMVSSHTNTWVTVSIPTGTLGFDDNCQGLSEGVGLTEVVATGDLDYGTRPTLSPTPSLPGASQTQLSELKNELLAIFKKWQSTVMQRVRDLRVVAETPSQDYLHDQSLFAGRGRGHRGGRPGGRGYRGRGGVVIRSTGKQGRPR